MKSVVFKWTVLCAVIFGLVFAGCDSVSEESDDIGNVGNSDGSQTSGNYLSESVWTDGKISKEGQTNEYRIAVSEGSRYFIYMNNAYDGDKTKSAQTGLKITHSDGTKINGDYNNATKLFSAPYTFVASSTGTVTITVAASSGFLWGKGSGTYAIKYTSRPGYDTLSEDEWKEDKIIAGGQTNEYRIAVSEGARYFIYMNNARDGDGIKSAQTGLKITHSDGTKINGDYNNATKLFSAPYTFVASSTGTVTITVAASSGFLWEKGTGTYAIKYTENN
ncbi:MAG: hypothetical protein HDR51_06660 [Treponema sp.]|nr:hypothetical protein [Treponema sp.]